MTTITRVKALIARFDDEKNEELFAICTSQIAKLYRQEPAVLHQLIFDTLRNLMISKKTYKRLVGAALFEKIIDEVHEGVDQAAFLFDKGFLDFDPKSFVESLDKIKKDKNRTEINFDQFVNEDLFKKTQEYVKSFLVKKDNFLYSKSEKSIQAKEKAAKNGKVDEEGILMNLNEELMRNEDLEFLSKKTKTDHPKDQPPPAKKVKQFSETTGPDAEKQPKYPTTIFDLIYQLARYLVFHPNWEMRHGALLIFRAIGRKINKVLCFDLPAIEGSDKGDLNLQLDSQHKIVTIRGRDLASIANEINEDMKQKCFILLALDRFSDFLADKSNMTNRALGAEILVNLFTNIKNLDRFYFIFEFLFLQNVKNGWEPKQALVFFSKKILEADLAASKTANEEPIFSENILKKVSDSVLKIIEEHEEITETCAMFIQTLIRRPLERSTPNYFVSCQEKLIGCLKRTEDISYLPKSVFELFSSLLDSKLLDICIVDNLEELIKKFLFHENNEVRSEIFVFISQLLDNVKRGETHFKLDDQLLKFFYLAILFYHLIHKKDIFDNKDTSSENQKALQILYKEETDRVLSILTDIMRQIRAPELKDQLVRLLFKVLEEKNFDSAISHINVVFAYNIQRDFNVDYYGILELLIRLLQIFDASETERIFRFLEPELNANTLVYIPFFFSENSQDFTLSAAEKALEANQSILNVPFFDANLMSAISDLELFLVNNTGDIDLENLPELEKPILDILVLLDRKSDIKDHLVELHNNLIQLSKKLKESIEKKLVSYTKLKLCIEIEGQLLPKFLKLYDFSKKFILLVKCGAANRCLQDCIAKSTLPDRNKINLLVKPFLDIFSEKCPEFFADMCSKGLFKLVLTYRAEAKHPNFKIVSNLIKKAESSDIFCSNVKSYFSALFQFLGPEADTKFPELNDIFTNQTLAASYAPFILDIRNENTGEIVFAGKFLDNLESARYSGQSQKESLYKSLFLALNKEMSGGKSALMNRLLRLLYGLIIQRAEFGFTILNSLLDAFKTDFIHYAKIFLCENIRAINEQVDYEKSAIYESFSKILTLSYIDTESPHLQNIDETLMVEYEKGRLFLFEFKNNKNFNIDLSPIYNKKLKNFALREYQIEGIKWLFFLFKHSLSACLCDDMGLGKTIQALSSIAVIHSYSASVEKEIADATLNKAGVERKVSLIVCPNNLIPHWKKECENYISESILQPAFILANTLSESYPLSAFLEQNPNISLLICSYNVINRIQDLLDYKFHVAVLDEAHLIKNPKSATAISVKQLKSSVRLALTGTPIQNNVTELWSIFDFLMPMYLGQKESFRKEFKSLLDMNLLSLDMKKIELSEAQRKGLEGLHKKVLPFIMRREKKDVLQELPDKIIQDFNCEMTPAQAKLYEVFENQNFGQFIEQSISTLGDGKVEAAESKTSDKEIVKKSFFVVLSAMRKILNHPSLLPLHYILPDIGKDKSKGRKKKSKFSIEDSRPALDPIAQKEEELFMHELAKKSSLTPLLAQFAKSDDPDFFYSSGKFVSLKELLNNLDFLEEDHISCIDNANKMLLFTRSNETLALLQQFFSEKFPYIKYLALTNTQNQFQRADVVNRFNGSQEFKLLLLTPKIGGLGLNLSTANIVIMFDHDFNPMNDLQAMDRAHRLGQTKVVNVFRLVTTRTLEEKIMGIQKFKLTIANTVINVENASISNVKESDFVGFLETFANENAAKKTDNSLVETFGTYSKYLKETDLEEMWNEDEYDKEFI
jgi:SNF2 family DNA or RNA helicase